MSRRPRLNYLRAFDAAARRLSFSLAAEELNLSQAAISRQIRQLEQALGQALFIRHNRSLTLSEPGRAYYQLVREVLDRLDSVTDQLFPDAARDIVTVHCTPSVAALWLGPQLGAFHAAYPGVEVHLRTADLLPGRYRGAGGDLEIARLAPGAAMPEGARLLWEARILPVCAPGYLDRAGPFADAGAICGAALIHTVGYGNDWHRWARAFAAPGAEVLSGMTVDGLLIALDAACRDEGVMLGRRPLIDAHLADGRLVEAMPGHDGLRTAYVLKGVCKRRPVRVLADWLLAQAARDTAAMRKCEGVCDHAR